jgi:alkanesulfonate monooxygenase SsuD/methylene tetrahydromethanopterin reductase-like flavin-dependent oxidoreductase (luciferase family)
MAHDRAMPAVRFVLFLPQVNVSFPALVARARLAEDAGFDGVAVMDHLAPPAATSDGMYDSYVTLASLAAATTRLRIGHYVIGASLRHPAVLAKMVVSLDHLSDGRFDLGLGWGSQPGELQRFDVNPEPATRRAARLGETLEILGLLFGGGPVDYDGRFWQLRQAHQQPVPRDGRIPILIGGSSPRLTLPLVARFADWWVCAPRDLEHLAARRPLIGRARIATQRSIVLTPRAAASTHAAEADARFEAWPGLLRGSPELVADALVADVRLGVEQFFLPFPGLPSDDVIVRFGTEVIPAVRRAVAGDAPGSSR